MEKRFLQCAVALFGLVPVLAGGAGAVLGPGFFGLSGDFEAGSHERYLSALLLGIGLAFWISIPNIETHRARFTLLTAIVFLGGCARLAAFIATGQANAIVLFALAMELLVTPALCLWQWRVTERSAATI